jgi:hypothetical protein|tara:strand:- start:1065 stop:1418 length:354 start_codon:yes stop_codon:yes gene_type:complete
MMAYKVCKYRLNANGTIPDFLLFGHSPMGMHGHYVVVDTDTAPPRDNVMIGIVKDGGAGDFTEIASKSDLQTYLASVSGDWREPDPTDADPDNTKAFDNAANAKVVWDRLDACNATL